MTETSTDSASASGTAASGTAASASSDSGTAASGTAASPSAAAAPALSRRMVLLLAVACGVAVGNLYFPQAVSPLVASGLGVSADTAAFVVTAAQFGYAVGIFLLVPLGDRVPHRTLITTLFALTGLGLLGASAAPGLPALLGASVLIGVTTVIAPIVAPMAAGLVPPERRGAVTGTLLSGSIGGMLLSRAFGGALGEWLGWRAPYLVTAAVALVIALVLARTLPRTEPPSRGRYPVLLAESVRLLRAEPLLRLSCFYQAAVFGGFQALWTGAALLLTSDTYAAGASAVGVLALVNAGTMLATPTAGRQIDRRGPDVVNAVCTVAVLVAAAVLALAGLGGVTGLVALAAGSLLLDVAMQTGMIANQVRIFALSDEARSRLNTAYMTCAFVGGAAGSSLGALAYTAFGWSGVCGLIAALTLVTVPTAARRARGARADRRGRGGRGTPRPGR
ncbi:MFS transporter [Streptomyces sp. CC224B]|uniref:MFS transporter n=1 Tax=Streptomyces sp. CC224B TaxID=3044571 RepID=UPI0032C169DE